MEKTELKTLEDIDLGITGTMDLFHKLKLRAEAVKWYHRSDGNKHKFIMDFFNLTEDDLA